MDEAQERSGPRPRPCPILALLLNQRRERANLAWRRRREGELLTGGSTLLTERAEPWKASTSPPPRPPSRPGASARPRPASTASTRSPAAACRAAGRRWSAAAPAAARRCSAMEFLVRGATAVRRAGRVHGLRGDRRGAGAERRARSASTSTSWSRGSKLAIDYVRVERSEIEETGEYDLEGLFIRLGYAIDIDRRQARRARHHRDAVRRPFQRRPSCAPSCAGCSAGSRTRASPRSSPASAARARSPATASRSTSPTA